jgi:hypothetical protein
MSVTTEKLADTVAARAAIARRVARGKGAQAREMAREMAKARADAAQAKLANLPASWRVNERIERASGAARSASRQARTVMQDRVIPTVVPMASSAMDQASQRFDELMVASAPARKEAMRRGFLAAAALRGAEPMVAAAKKRRRWTVAVMFMVIGGAIGAGAAWLSQAGKPVQLTPYPIPAEAGDQMVDLTAEDRASDDLTAEDAHHES